MRFVRRSALVLLAVMFGFSTLRKLHLVRPDLIFYPMFVEVYC